MKNYFYQITFLILAILLVSCSNEEVSDEISESNLITTVDNSVVAIDSNELPLLSNTQSRKLGFISLDNDNKRVAYLDKKTNTLKVPYNAKTSIKSQNRDGIGLCIRITIARQNPSNNCQGGCIECIGFRCEFITFPCIINERSSNTNPSQEREQTADVILDENNEIIEYQFHNEIDWEYLANN